MQYEILTRSEIRRIRLQVKTDRNPESDSRRTRRRMRRFLADTRAETGGNGMFGDLKKPGKFISESYSSSRDYKMAYAAKRAEVEFYESSLYSDWS